MDFKPFDKSEIERCKAEVKEKWGTTQAYGEYVQKTSGRSEGEQGKAAEKLLSKFAELGKLRGMPPDTAEVQEKISGLRKFITDNYYECTGEILSELGQTYTSDERFRKNIDKAGGEGTAEFVSHAISVYCSRCTNS